MIVYIVTMNHVADNHSVWSTREAAINAAKALVESDDRVYEAWVETWAVDTGDAATEVAERITKS